MRKWMRERLSRRKKKAPDTEQTGRIGQERPKQGLAPLQPSYGDVPPSAPRTVEPPPQRARTEDPAPPRERIEPAPRRERHEQAPSRRRPELPPAHRGRPAPAAQPLKQRYEVETQPESLGSPPSSDAIGKAPHAAPRPPKGVVVLAIGLPGSGKTTWFKRRGITPLSSDMLRTILFDNITEQRYQHLVFATLRSLLRARLIARMPFNYVDATNLSPNERRQWIKMSKSLGYDVQAVFFDVPLEVCMERNRRRERMVPEDVMRRMASKLKPPTFEEGFSKVVVVRVKQKPGEET